ncbi:hypothetical protein QS257_09260 [Terrilactibacillus sp. S3-3]|nr:hypothetical protein QS257_09260 [Terrilactibacillus sp. S3-3]
MMITAFSMEAIQKIIDSLAPYADTVTSVVFSQLPAAGNLVRLSPRIRDKKKEDGVKAESLRLFTNSQKWD